jgi:DHA2 family multidrug resistance protein
LRLGSKAACTASEQLVLKVTKAGDTGHIQPTSMSRIPKERMGNATSIFNLMRNIGGRFGIAIMTTFLVRRTQVHQNRLIENVNPGNLRVRETLQGMQAWFHAAGADSYDASRKALAALYGMVQRHASMLSFVEAFWLMGILFLIMVPFILLLRNPRHPVETHIPPPPRSSQERSSATIPQEEDLLVGTH